MTGHACLQSTSYFFPALTLLTFWVTFCVTFHLTNTTEQPVMKMIWMMTMIPIQMNKEVLPKMWA